MIRGCDIVPLTTNDKICFLYFQDSKSYVQDLQSRGHHVPLAFGSSVSSYLDSQVIC